MTRRAGKSGGVSSGRSWEDGKHGILVEDTLRSCIEYLTVSQREESAEHREQTNHSLVLWGKVQMAV